MPNENPNGLTDATVPSCGYEYTYDAVGNRLTKLVGSNTHTYAYGTTSNRIASITPTSGPVRSFTLDANGSSTADGINTYAYDVRGRMVQAVSSLGTTNYHVNALGQRVRKTNSLGDRVFTYAAGGHLIAESTAAGVTLREYVWLGDMPVAVVDGTTRNYVHVDHLNTPRLVANQSGQTVWRWDQQEPFGDNIPNENPSGLGTFEFALRFPGQYADKETNLFYNYFRDYDSGIGRYSQSDPIGLNGGLNTYAYVDGNALSYADPYGLIRGARPRGQARSAKGTANPYKHMKPHPKDPSKVIVTDPVTGKKIEKPKPADFGKQKGFADPNLLEWLIPWWLTPSELACAELDCDENGIPDHLEPISDRQGMSDDSEMACR